MARQVALPGGFAADVPPVRHGPALSVVGPRVQAVLAVLGVYLYSGAKLTLTAAPAAAEMGAVDPLNRLLQLVVLGGCGLLALLAGRPTLRAALRLWPYVLILGLIVASAAWSVSPGHTLRRSLAMAALLAFVLATATQLGPVRLMRILLGTVLALALLSLLEAALRPAVGFDTGEYANAIRGVFPQKNVLGMALLFAAIALSFLVLERGRLRWTDGAWLVGLLGMLVLARSTTSLVLTVAVAGLTVFILFVARGGLWAAAMALAAAVGAAAGLLAFTALGTEGLFDILGKDPTLTGRTPIWAALWDVAAQRPLLGHGFAAFWLENARPVRGLTELVQWDVPNAHSGYLEVLLQLGWVGMALVAVMAAHTLALALRAAMAGQMGRALWAVMVLGILATINRTESVLLNPDFPMLFWLLAIVALREGLRPMPPREAPSPDGFLARDGRGRPAPFIIRGRG